MITPTVAAAKYAVIPVSILAAFDPTMAGGIAFGMISGWFLNAAMLVGKPEGKKQIATQFVASLMAAGVGILIILWAVRWGNLDPLGAATVAAAVGWAGAKGAERFMTRTFDQIMGDRAQEAQKLIAAAKIAQAEKDKDDGS